MAVFFIFYFFILIYLLSLSVGLRVSMQFLDLVRWGSPHCALDIYKLKLTDELTGSLLLSQPAVPSAFTITYINL